MADEAEASSAGEQLAEEQSAGDSSIRWGRGSTGSPAFGVLSLRWSARVLASIGEIDFPLPEKLKVTVAASAVAGYIVEYEPSEKRELVGA